MWLNARQRIQTSYHFGTAWSRKSREMYGQIALPIRRTLHYILAISCLAVIVRYLPNVRYDLTLTASLGVAVAISASFVWPSLRSVLVALILFISLAFALHGSNEMKISVTSFPITSIDIQPTFPKWPAF